MKCVPAVGLTGHVPCLPARKRGTGPLSIGTAQDSHRPYYVREPEGIIAALAQQLN